MAYMPKREELDGRLQMDQDGYKTVVGHVAKAYEYTKTGKSYYVEWELYETDETTPLMEGDKQRKIIDYVPTDMRHFRFLQYIDGLCPELSKGGCDFNPQTHWEGKRGILQIEYDKEAEANGQRPRLRVKRVTKLKAATAAAKPATPPPAARQTVPDNPF